MSELSPGFYYLVGSLIVANLGTIGSIILYGGKAVWWISKLDSRVEKTERDITAAHDKLRDIKGESHG